ncbi:hypothetical protein KY311_02330, partial [Candidatus Woesearchaeota archaeon]|nr:hypothetical protein [Candidatus Woesearchaeota archaeon]
FDVETKNYCYLSIPREYNRLMRVKPNPLVVHQTADGTTYYVPKPAVPQICGDVQDSKFKTYCEYVFDEFNSLNVLTLSS